MKTVVSEERATGMGAIRFTAVEWPRDTQPGTKWRQVGTLPGAVYLGRENGVERYSLEVPDETLVAGFYRSNSGREQVTVVPDGPSFGSFDAARLWLAGERVQDDQGQMVQRPPTGPRSDAHGWMRSSAVMPEDRGGSLWLWHGELSIGWYANGEFWAEAGGGERALRGVTHWQRIPTPEPPEEARGA